MVPVSTFSRHPAIGAAVRGRYIMNCGAAGSHVSGVTVAVAQNVTHVTGMAHDHVLHAVAEATNHVICVEVMEIPTDICFYQKLRSFSNSTENRNAIKTTSVCKL